MQGKVELAEALDTMGNGGRELLEKRRGDERVFIPGRGSGWQMKPAQTPYRGGEGDHGAAKAHGVVHRYRDNHIERLPTVTRSPLPKRQDFQGFS